MKPIEYFLKSNLYAWKCPATPSEMRLAVPPDITTDLYFKVAVELININIMPYEIRNIIIRINSK